MKFGDKLRQIIGVAAPTIGGALGGPLGGLAGNFVAKALGVDDDAAALAKLQTDPSAMVALKQADLDFQKHLADIGVELEQITATDRADARARQIALKDNMPAVVFGVTSLGFFGLLVLIVFRGLPASGSDAVLSMVGTLGTVWIAAATYFVGSSRESAKKGETIAAIAQQP